MEFLYSVHFQANSMDFHLQVWTVPNKRHVYYMLLTYRMISLFCVMVYLDTNIFLFLLSIFLDLIFLFFIFIFIFNDEEAHDYGHMTCHMMWYHMPRLWEKKLEK